MTVLTLPSSPGFAGSEFGLTYNTKSFRSELSFNVQTIELPGAIWKASYTLPPMRHEQAGAWQAFLLSLRGQAGRFYGFDPDYAIKGARGTPNGTPLVDGADQTGLSLAVSGFDVSTTVFKAGDQFAFETAAGRELKMVTDTVVSDASGNATIPFVPAIRNAPADGAALIVAAPSCIMMLNSPELSWSTDAYPFYSLSFSAVEVF